MSMFYVYRQNNSGGVFVRDQFLDRYVIIEAMDMEEAQDKAIGFGIYFDGVEYNIDCSCCGDRWYAAADAYNSLEEIDELIIESGNFKCHTIQKDQ